MQSFSIYAQNAFQQLVGRYINGYAFGDIDQLVPIIERVQSEGRVVPELTKIYPGVIFKPKSQWDAGNKGLNEGLTKLLMTLKAQKASIKQQRIEHGMAAKFTKSLTNLSRISSVFASVGASFWRNTGLLLMNQSISAAVRRLGGCVLYSPPFHAESLRMASIITRRHARLRPEIWIGKLASGISPSMKSGCSSPQSQVCIPPIEVPITSRARLTPSPSVSRRYCASTMSR